MQNVESSRQEYNAGTGRQRKIRDNGRERPSNIVDVSDPSSVHTLSSKRPWPSIASSRIHERAGDAVNGTTFPEMHFIRELRGAE
eukprot:30897-Pelagococcus_subviridis.AAC.6